MRLTASSRDTVLAVLDLAIHSDHAEGKAIKLQSIADRQMIPLSWLEQLFSRLRKQGIVSSIRGPGGGYLLAKHPSEISISCLIACASGAIDMRECKGKENCHINQRCLAHNLWEYINRKLHITLSQISIQDMMQNLDLSSCDFAVKEYPESHTKK